MALKPAQKPREGAIVPRDTLLRVSQTCKQGLANLCCVI
jgi:hypothetical protein